MAFNLNDPNFQALVQQAVEKALANRAAPTTPVNAYPGVPFALTPIQWFKLSIPNCDQKEYGFFVTSFDTSKDSINGDVYKLELFSKRILDNQILRNQPVIITVDVELIDKKDINKKKLLNFKFKGVVSSVTYQQTVKYGLDDYYRHSIEIKQEFFHTAAVNKFKQTYIHVGQTRAKLLETHIGLNGFELGNKRLKLNLKNDIANKENIELYVKNGTNSEIINSLLSESNAALIVDSETGNVEVIDSPLNLPAPVEGKEPNYLGVAKDNNGVQVNYAFAPIWKFDPAKLQINEANIGFFNIERFSLPNAPMGVKVNEHNVIDPERDEILQATFPKSEKNDIQLSIPNISTTSKGVELAAEAAISPIRARREGLIVTAPMAVGFIYKLWNKLSSAELQKQFAKIHPQDKETLKNLADSYRVDAITFSSANVCQLRLLPADDDSSLPVNFENETVNNGSMIIPGVICNANGATDIKSNQRIPQGEDEQRGVYVKLQGSEAAAKAIWCFTAGIDLLPVEGTPVLCVATSSVGPLFAIGAFSTKKGPAFNSKNKDNELVVGAQPFHDGKLPENIPTMRFVNGADPRVEVHGHKEIKIRLTVDEDKKIQREVIMTKDSIVTMHGTATSTMNAKEGITLSYNDPDDNNVKAQFILGKKGNIAINATNTVSIDAKDLKIKLTNLLQIMAVSLVSNITKDFKLFVTNVFKVKAKDVGLYATDKYTAGSQTGKSTGGRVSDSESFKEQ